MTPLAPPFSEKLRQATDQIGRGTYTRRECPGLPNRPHCANRPMRDDRYCAECRDEFNEIAA